jgi:predicted molibdopterin-dependent oxidoreductase YjgC
MNSVIPPAKRVTFTFDGKDLNAAYGQTLAAAILNSGARILRETRINDRPRGLFCGIGVCFDCLVVIDGAPNQRSCLVEVAGGMRVETQIGAGRR